MTMAGCVKKTPVRHIKEQALAGPNACTVDSGGAGAGTVSDNRVELYDDQLVAAVMKLSRTTPICA